MLANIPTFGLINSLIIFIIIILSVSFHEFSHALIAHLRGDDTAKYSGRLTLNPIAHFEPVGFLLMLFTNFGWGKPVPVNPANLENPAQDSILVSISGPISNIILALLASLILHIAPYLPAFFVFVFSMTIIINIGLAIFNLLPIPPLDGSAIYRSFLPYKWQAYLSSPNFILLIVFVAFLPIFQGQSLISFVISPIIGFFSQILIP